MRIRQLFVLLDACRVAYKGTCLGLGIHYLVHLNLVYAWVAVSESQISRTRHLHTG